MDTDKLEAGRELDALIAEKVMSLNVLGVVNGERDPEGCFGHHIMIPFEYCPKDSIETPIYLAHCLCEFREESDIDYFGHTAGCLEVVPWYSTNIAAAWEVVEALNSMKLGWFSLEQFGSKGQDEWSALIWVSGGESDCFFADAETVPLAICRMALKAVEV